MASAPFSVPKGALGAIVFGTADGFDVRGIGALKQPGDSLVSRLDMRGGVIDLRGFEQDAVPAWFAIPLKAGSAAATFLGQVRPCRDATNRAGLAGAGVALPVRSDEYVLPRWRARQAFGLSSALLDRLVEGRGFDARLNLRDWKWPESLRDIAKTKAMAPAVQSQSGQLRRMSIDAEWIYAVNDPTALFGDYLKTVPPGGLGPGVLIEAVSSADRRREHHLSTSDLANRDDGATRHLEARLQEEVRRADGLERAGKLQHGEIIQLKANEAVVADKLSELRDKNAELDALVSRQLEQLDEAKRGAKNATARVNEVKREARKKIGQLKDKHRKDLSRRSSKYQRRDTSAVDDQSQIETIASLSRVLGGMVVRQRGFDWLDNLEKVQPGIRGDINALKRFAGREDFEDVLRWLAELDREFQSTDAALHSEPDIDGYDEEFLDEPSFTSDASNETPFESITRKSAHNASAAEFPGSETRRASDADPSQSPRSSTLQTHLDEDAAMRSERPFSAPPRSRGREAHVDQNRSSAHGGGGSSGSRKRRRKASRGDTSFAVIIPLMFVILMFAGIGTFIFTSREPGPREPEAISERSNRSSQPRAPQAPAADEEMVCASPDKSCVRALDAARRDVASIVSELDALTLTIDTARDVLGSFEDAHELFARARRTGGGDGVELMRALSRLNEEVSSQGGAGETFAGILNQKRDQLTSEGQDDRDFQVISGNLARLQDEFGR